MSEAEISRREFIRGGSLAFGGLVAACAVRVCPRGDINLDGVVDVSDVNICINIVLDKDNAANYNRRAYITDDNVVDIGDVNALINILLGH